jgi:glycosyltransferase involved in cell wall biosynthesis
MPSLPDAHLTVIGDGPSRLAVEAEAAAIGVAGRCTFIPSMANDEVCGRLREWDVFATHSDYPEIPKAVLEPFLVGMPIVINRPASDRVPEYESAPCRVVENTPGAYASALSALIGDDAARESLGRDAGAHAWKNWAPEVTEQRYASIYREVMA